MIIRIDESSDLGVIVAALEVIESRFAVTTVALLHPEGAPPPGICLASAESHHQSYLEVTLIFSAIEKFNKIVLPVLFRVYQHPQRDTALFRHIAFVQ